MCGYFCIGFIDCMLVGKTLIDCTNTFSPYNFNKNDSIILSYFKDAWNKLNKNKIKQSLDCILIKNINKIS